MSEFIPEDDILTLSIADDEKFFFNAPAKSESLYTQDFAPVIATFTPDLCLAKYTPTTA